MASSYSRHEAVRTWGSEDLLKWLGSITPPPLSKHAETIKAFVGSCIDGPVFLDLGSRWFSEGVARGVPLGVAKRLDMLCWQLRYRSIPS